MEAAIFRRSSASLGRVLLRLLKEERRERRKDWTRDRDLASTPSVCTVGWRRMIPLHKKLATTKPLLLPAATLRGEEGRGEGGMEDEEVIYRAGEYVM